MIEPGQSAPHVDRIAHDGTHVRIGGPQPHVTVLYFYPKDETAGCIKEACAFRDSYVDFIDAGAVVVGVSDDDDASHRAFAEHRRLPFALLHDRGGELRTAYRVPDWLGLLRNRVTYVIDREGIVRMAFESQLRAGTHVTRALEIVRALGC